VQLTNLIQRSAGPSVWNLHADLLIGDNHTEVGWGHDPQRTHEPHTIVTGSGIAIGTAACAHKRQPQTEQDSANGSYQGDSQKRA
jgi:hypothetical protein